MHSKMSSEVLLGPDGGANILGYSEGYQESTTTTQRLQDETCIGHQLQPQFFAYRWLVFGVVDDLSSEGDASCYGFVFFFLRRQFKHIDYQVDNINIFLEC